MKLDLEIMDVWDALKRSMDDPAFLRMMLDDFQQMLPDFLARFETGIDQNAPERLGKDAHQLKGAASSLGAGRVVSAVSALEQCARMGQMDEARVALAKIRDSVEEFWDQVAQINWAEIQPS